MIERIQAALPTVAVRTIITSAVKIGQAQAINHLGFLPTTQVQVQSLLLLLLLITNDG
jgi:hypothetical protein